MDERRLRFSRAFARSKALPLAEASWPARPALVANEAVTGARFIPEDVRMVTQDHVAFHEIVLGHRPFDSAHYDHPSREGRRPGWDVLENLVPANLDVPRAQQANAHPRAPRRLCSGRAGVGVVLHRIAVHCERARRSRRVGEEYYPYAGVVGFVGGDPSMERVSNQDARGAVVGVVISDRCIRMWRVTYIYCRVLCAAGDVRDDLRPSREEGGNPVLPVVEGTVLYELGVPGAEGDDPEVPEVSDREARYGDVLHVLRDLTGLQVYVTQGAQARRPTRRAWSVGRLEHGFVAHQRDPVLADHHVLSVNSPHDDSVARIGSIYGLLDGLARPNDRALCSGGADLGDGQGHPACHQHRQSHGGQQHYGASHRKTRLP